MSFRAFRGRTLTTRRAGLALNMTSSLVKGLIPLRALVAGLLITLIFIRPGTLNTPGPFLPTALPICFASASKTDDTCLRDSSVDSEIRLMISLLEAGLVPFAIVWALLNLRLMNPPATRFYRVLSSNQGTDSH